MRRILRRRTMATLGALAVAAGIFLSAPSQPSAQEADCGDNDGSVCKEVKTCVFFIFCGQPSYDYYKKPALLETG